MHAGDVGYGQTLRVETDGRLSLPRFVAVHPTNVPNVCRNGSRKKTVFALSPRTGIYPNRGVNRAKTHQTGQHKYASQSQ
jgi:hypothetical protein